MFPKEEEAAIRKVMLERSKVVLARSQAMVLLQVPGQVLQTVVGGLEVWVREVIADPALLAEEHLGSQEVGVQLVVADPAALLKALLPRSSPPCPECCQVQEHFQRILDAVDIDPLLCFHPGGFGK
jgi:hypothetical protein